MLSCNKGCFAGRNSDWGGEFGAAMPQVLSFRGWRVVALPVQCTDLGSPDLSLLNLEHSSFCAVLKMEKKFLKMSLHKVDLVWKMSLGRLGVVGVSL